MPTDKLSPRGRQARQNRPAGERPAGREQARPDPAGGDETFRVYMPRWSPAEAELAVLRAESDYGADEAFDHELGRVALQLALTKVLADGAGGVGPAGGAGDGPGGRGVLELIAEATGYTAARLKLAVQLHCAFQSPGEYRALLGRRGKNGRRLTLGHLHAAASLFDAGAVREALEMALAEDLSVGALTRRLNARDGGRRPAGRGEFPPGAAGGGLPDADELGDRIDEYTSWLTRQEYPAPDGGPAGRREAIGELRFEQLRRERVAARYARSARRIAAHAAELLELESAEGS